MCWFVPFFDICFVRNSFHEKKGTPGGYLPEPDNFGRLFRANCIEGFFATGAVSSGYSQEDAVVDDGGGGE